MRSNVTRGILAGLIAGVVIGIALQAIALTTPAGSRVIMMEVVSAISGPKSLLIGWTIHLFDSILMGAIFGTLVGAKVFTYGDGLKYGSLCSLAWWILGGIFFMPIFLGLSVFSPETTEPLQPVALQSLIGHIVFGLIYGGVFVALQKNSRKSEVQKIGRGQSDQSDRSRFKAG